MIEQKRAAIPCVQGFDRLHKHQRENSIKRNPRRNLGGPNFERPYLGRIAVPKDAKSLKILLRGTCFWDRHQILEKIGGPYGLLFLLVPSQKSSIKLRKTVVEHDQNCLVKRIVGAATQKECKRARGIEAVTMQTQALTDFSLQVRKGNTWPLRVKEYQEGEEGRFWLAKIKEDPVRLEGTMTFAGQVFKEGWIVAKAQYYSLLHERGPETAR